VSRTRSSPTSLARVPGRGRGRQDDVHRRMIPLYEVWAGSRLQRWLPPAREAQTLPLVRNEGVADMHDYSPAGILIASCPGFLATAGRRTMIMDSSGRIVAKTGRDHEKIPQSGLQGYALSPHVQSSAHAADTIDQQVRAEPERIRVSSVRRLTRLRCEAGIHVCVLCGYPSCGGCARGRFRNIT
jgi:hypothetical protein